MLDLILQRLADFLEKAAKLKRRVVGAMIYPAVVLCVAAVIVLGIMIWSTFSSSSTSPFLSSSFPTASSARAPDIEAEYVMGVSVGGKARAYPILMVAYYHIVHDEIDGEPYVVTY